MPLLHRLQQRALHLRWRAINFVSEDKIRKKRAKLGREFASARIVNERADQVCGQKVGGKLQPLKAGLNAGGHRFHAQRFGQTRDAFKQDVTVREQAEQKPIDQIFLADHNMRHLFAHRRNPAAQFLHFVRDLLSRFHTV